MASNLRRVYWDSCCFLSYLERTDGRYETLAALLGDAAEHKHIEIWTSTVTIVEVAFGAEDRLDDESEALIDLLWRDPTINLVEFNPVVARQSRALIRRALELHRKTGHTSDQLPRLKPADAIHLASAEFCKAREFHTYDPKLLRQSALTSMTIREPGGLQGRLL